MKCFKSAINKLEFLEHCTHFLSIAHRFLQLDGIVLQVDLDYVRIRLRVTVVLVAVGQTAAEAVAVVGRHCHRGRRLGVVDILVEPHRGRPRRVHILANTLPERVLPVP